MSEIGESQTFTTPEMTSLYARLQKENLAKVMLPTDQAIRDRLKNAASGLPNQTREDSVIDPEELQSLQEKIDELRGLVITRGERPFLAMPDKDVPIYKSVWEGEKDSTKFYMEADPGTNIDKDDITRLVLTENVKGQTYTDLTFFFNGTFECKIVFSDKTTTRYESGTQKIEQMTKEESAIIKSALEQGQKALAPKLN